jgi:hypothetical protein
MTRIGTIARLQAALLEVFRRKGHAGSKAWIDNTENPAKSSQIQPNPAKSRQRILFLKIKPLASPVEAEPFLSETWCWLGGVSKRCFAPGFMAA